MKGIFICYRHDDAQGNAGRLYGDLRRRFADGTIFRDVDIAAGSHFPTVLNQKLSACRILLAVIGRQWLEAKDRDGRRRLDDPNDWVRLEIATALASGVHVIPVFVDDASAPHAHQLPEDLRNFAFQQGVELSDSRWDTDFEQVIAAIAKHGLKGDRVLKKVIACLPIALVALFIWALWVYRSEVHHYLVFRGRSGAPITYTITACVDGKDDLHIRGKTLQWERRSFDPVGNSVNCADNDVSISSTFDGASDLQTHWRPTSPTLTLSDSFTHLVPPLSDKPQIWIVEKIRGRGNVSVLQQPNIANGWTLILRFDDEAFAGADVYSVYLKPHAASG
jgi:hypothetical protein